MSAAESYADLKKRMKEISLLNSTESVLYWDREAYLPPLADDYRGDQLAQLSSLTHSWLTDPKVGDLLSAVEESELVDDAESEAAVNVREWRREYNRETKLPKEFVEEFARVTSKACSVWAEARKRSDFDMFAPHLEKVVDLCRRKADYFGYETERYDALLDEFEPGAKTKEIEDAFVALRKELVELNAKIADAPRKPNVKIIKQHYDVDRQKIFAEIVAGAFGYNFRAGRFDLSAHPSCNGLGPRDVRVLTRYYADDFAEGLTAATHEVGHALYELSRDDVTEWGTPYFETGSLGIHESQSRLWENIVGRSREFWTHFLPSAQAVFPEQLGNVTLDEIYGAMNWVAPSYIRVEADEATYNLHIMLRFEMERAIIAGDMQVKDIPGEWNSRFKNYLGIDVDKDSNGCLQDIHWSDGGIGYFPTYALGNMYAAQFWSRAEKDLPNLKSDFERGDFTRLRNWLRDNIHDRGSTFLARDLCQRVTGEPISHKALIDYLYDKYEDIYGIERG